MLTTTLALGLVAVGALAAALTETVGGPPILQLAVFVAVSLTRIVLIRPLALRRLKGRTTFPTGTAALVGQTGYVPADVSPHPGRVRIRGGGRSARPSHRSSVTPAGSALDVLPIEVA